MKIEDNLKEIFTDKNNIKWDAYFMALAKLSAFRSKDPNTKVGACIVNKNKYVVSLGYNGMPTGVNETRKNNDEYFSWDRPKDKDDVLNSKYTFVIHAEQNAIINANIETIIKVFSFQKFLNASKARIKYSKVLNFFSINFSLIFSKLIISSYLSFYKLNIFFNFSHFFIFIF